jgi:ribosome biogenesis protein NSA1
MPGKIQLLIPLPWPHCDTVFSGGTIPSEGMLAFTGGETGLLKEVKLGSKPIVSIWNESQDRAMAIESMCWAGHAVHGNQDTSDVNGNGVQPAEELIAVSRRCGTVEIRDRTREGRIVSLIRTSPGKTAGLAVQGTSVVMEARNVIHCSTTGRVTIQRLPSVCNDARAEESKGYTFEVGRGQCAFNLESSAQTEFVVGGKESSPAVWSIERRKRLWRAKNMAHDHLDLPVPIGVTDLAFLVPRMKGGRGSLQHQFLALSSHRHIRLYDCRAGRRPVRSVEFGNTAWKTMSIDPNGRSFVAADVKGTMEQIDIGTFKRINRLKGSGGSIRCLSHHPTQPLLASVGLDRWLRVHDTQTRRVQYKCYLKQRLNAVLLSSNTSHVDKFDTAELGDCSLGTGDANGKQSKQSEVKENMWMALDRRTRELRELFEKQRTKRAKAAAATQAAIVAKETDSLKPSRTIAFDAEISGDGLSTSKYAKGVLEVSRSGQLAGSYIVQKADGGWYPQCILKGTLPFPEAGIDMTSAPLILKTLALRDGRKTVLSSLQGALHLKDCTAKLVGTNAAGAARVWSLTFERPAIAAFASDARQQSRPGCLGNHGGSVESSESSESSESDFESDFESHSENESFSDKKGEEVEIVEEKAKKNGRSEPLDAEEDAKALDVDDDAFSIRPSKRSRKC